AMVSHPSFDPNDFAKRIDRVEWERLTDDPMKPMMNKAIQAQLAPGSVFKIITATAALETGTIQQNFTLNCSGAVNIYGHTYHDCVWDWGSELESICLGRCRDWSRRPNGCRRRLSINGMRARLFPLPSARERW